MIIYLNVYSYILCIWVVIFDLFSNRTYWVQVEFIYRLTSF